MCRWEVEAAPPKHPPKLKKQRFRILILQVRKKRRRIRKRLLSTNLLHRRNGEESRNRSLCALLSSIQTVTIARRIILMPLTPIRSLTRKEEMLVLVAISMMSSRPSNLGIKQTTPRRKWVKSPNCRVAKMQVQVTLTARCITWEAILACQTQAFSTTTHRRKHHRNGSLLS